MTSTILTGDLLKDWDKSGRNKFLEACKILLDSNRLGDAMDSLDLRRAVYDIIMQFIINDMKLEQLIRTLKNLLELNMDFQYLIVDAITIIDVEITSNGDGYEEQKERLISLIQQSSLLVGDSLLRERLDGDSLETAGFIPSKIVYNQKYVKTRTKIYYKQQKFNLLREESEGYSKLITELNQDFEPIKNTSLLQNILSLIGCFNLDPNRVLDIILDSFEMRPAYHDLFVPLIRAYSMDKNTLCHIVGFKFHFFQQTRELITSESLYRLTAILLKHNLISLDILFPHLQPSDAVLVDEFKKSIAEARACQQKINLVTISDKNLSEEASKDAVVDDKMENPHSNNQKFGLCEHLLKIGYWEGARQLMALLPPYMVVSYSPVANNLTNLIDYIIDPIYREKCGLPAVLLPPPLSSKTQPDFADVKQATTYDEFVSLVVPMLCQLGPHLSTDPILLIKLNRIAKSYIARGEKYADQSPPSFIFCNLLTIYDEAILPSLSVLPNNCSVSEEVWTFLKLLKYEYRYRLYGQWKNESRHNHPILIRNHANVLSKTKYIMKRLTKENVKQLGRQIGKLSHCSPGTVFELILLQIQKYDNLIAPVVDFLKFLTSLSYDVLAYCIIEALANPEGERLKTDGTNISAWLQILANFCGSVFKKYQVDIVGLLHYVVNQLKCNKSYDLLVLHDVVYKMAGIEVSEEITNDQLLAMSGGELLKQEGGYFSQVRNTKKAASRLMDSLSEHRLTVPLCLMMAHQRSAIIFSDSTVTIATTAPNGDVDVDRRPVKLIGKLYDQCQDTLGQFISFLLLQLSTNELRNILPSMNEMSVANCLPSDVVFALWRGILSHDISQKYDELKVVEKKDKTLPAKYSDAVEIVMKPVRQNIIEPMMPPKLWDELTCQFFSTFWCLSLYDLEVPKSAYESQFKQHQIQLKAIEDNKDLAQSKKKKEIERCNQLTEKMREEMRKQEEHAANVLQRLKVEKDSWFSAKLVKHSTITAILQWCVFPRCCFSTVDALYVAKFLRTMHALKTPNFSSLICYDRIFTDITWSLTCCTENEAHRYGRFLCTILNDIMSWHADQAVYDKECANFPGFVTVFRSPTTANQNAVADHLDYENYRHVVHKWQYSLTKVSVNCLESNDYIQIRNMLIILTKILPNYPRVQKLGVALERRIEKVIEVEKDKRQDLHVLALAYLGQLKMTKKNWDADHVFHKKEQEKVVTTNSSGTAKNSEKSENEKSSKSRSKDKLDSSALASKSSDTKITENKIEVDVHKEERKSNDSSSSGRHRDSKVNKTSPLAEDRVGRNTSSSTNQKTTLSGPANQTKGSTTSANQTKEDESNNKVGANDDRGENKRRRLEVTNRVSS